MSIRPYWKPAKYGKCEDWPEILDSAAFFEGCGAGQVKLTERIAITVDVMAPDSWAKDVSRQAFALIEPFRARGYRLLGVARMDVSDQVMPVWVALLMEESKA